MQKFKPGDLVYLDQNYVEWVRGLAEVLTQPTFYSTKIQVLNAGKYHGEVTHAYTEYLKLVPQKLQ